MAPPLILLSTDLPAPGSCGSTKSLTLANCPAPPLCFLWVYSTSEAFSKVSLYAT